MTSQFSVDNDYRKSLQKALVNDLIAAVEKGELSFVDMRASANFILDNLEKIESKDSLKDFLKELHIKWPSYSSTYKIHTADNEEKEKEVIDKLSSYIKSFE